MGSIILNKPLEHQFPMGSVVKKKVRTAGEETAKTARAPHVEAPPVGDRGRSSEEGPTPAEEPTPAPSPFPPTPMPSDKPTASPTLALPPVSPTSKPTDDPTAAPMPKSTPEAEEKAIHADPENYAP